MLRFFLVGVCLQASLCVAECVNVTKTAQFGADYSDGWGVDLRNTRYQARSELTAESAPRLQLKWVYALSNDTPRSYPYVTEDTIFIGDAGRGVVALERETGCERWVFAHDGYIASAILHARAGQRELLIFNDRITGVYAIDAVTGEFVWHARLEEQPLAWFSGTPLIHGDRVYVPVASQEVGLALNPFYGCCTTSGGMVAFDLHTGKRLWYQPTIATPAEQTGSHWFFVQKYGPSGAPVWGAPSFDVQRDILYFGTGQNYSHPTTGTSNALFAMDAENGEILWQQQFTANDAYTAACNLMALNHPNCPKPTGPDVDFGAPTVLTRTPAGDALLLGGQKSGEVHAVDPLTGARVWTQRVGRGGIIGGIHWGLAVNEQAGLVFAPISDKAILDFPAPGKATPGLYALDITTGVQRWHYARPSRCADTACEYGLSAAPLATNDVVITGSMDGFVEVYRADTGERLWVYDAWQEFPAVNGATAHGGAFDAHGPMVADDLLMITAGYSYVGAQRGGNAFLVFEVGGAHD
ncbi:MAG: PQQ-binding-like beta-propeller repeat protein [Pseudomonadota bacterium]